MTTYASLRFSGDRLEPDRITAILGIPPSLAYRKGEVFKRSRGHDIRGRTGLWLLYSKGGVASLDLNDHLQHLLAVALQKRGERALAELRHYMREADVEADVGCFWYGEHGARPPVIREDIRERFACLPAEIEEDFDTD